MNDAKSAALEAALKIVALASVVVAAVSLLRLPVIGFQPGMVVHTLFPIALVTAWRWPRQLPPQTLAALLVSTLLAYGYNGLLSLGSLDVNSLLFMGAVLLSFFTLSRAIAFAIALLVSASILWAEMSQGLHPLTALINYGAWAVVLGLFAMSFWIYHRKLNEALSNTTSKNDQLRSANMEFGELSTRQRDIFLAMDKSGLGLAMFDRQSGDLREYNKSFSICLGGEAEQLPLNWQALQDRLEPIAMAHWDQKEQSSQRYCRYTHPDGRRIPIAINDNRVTHEGEASEIVVMIRDATRILQNQIALQASERKLGVALSARKLHLYEYDPATDQFTLTPKLRGLLGIPGGETSPVNADDVLSRSTPAQARHLRQLLSDLVEGRESRYENGEFQFLGAGGSALWLCFAGEMSSDINEDGRPILIGTAEDITLRKKLELALIESQQAGNAVDPHMEQCKNPPETPDMQLEPHIRDIGEVAVGHSENQDALEIFFQQSRILVVDDDHLTLLSLTRSLGLFGADVTNCQDGLSGLQTIRDNEVPFDLVLMDLTMPVLDGMAAAREIRKLAHHAQPLIMLGMANSREGAENEHLLQAGMDGCVLKPVTPEEIFNIVQAIQRQGKLQQLGHL